MGKIIATCGHEITDVSIAQTWEEYDREHKLCSAYGSLCKECEEMKFEDKTLIKGYFFTENIIKKSELERIEKDITFVEKMKISDLDRLDELLFFRKYNEEKDHYIQRVKKLLWS